MFQRLLWHDAHAWPIAGIILAAAVVIVTWLYPPQVRQLPHAWRWILPGLRALAVAALALSLLKPAVARPPSPAEQGPIVILIDHSMSMSVRDTGRSPAQLVALAQSLHMLPPRPQTQLLSSLQSSWQSLRVQLDELILARSALEYAKLTSHGMDAARERLRRISDVLEQSLRAQLDQAQSLEDPADLPQRYEQLNVSVARQEETPVIQLRDELQQLGDALSQRRAMVDQQLYETDELVRERCDELMALSRFELIEKILLDQQAGLVLRLSSEAPVIAYGLANQLTPITLAGGADDGTRLPLTPTAAESDLFGGVCASAPLFSRCRPSCSSPTAGKSAAKRRCASR
jgi:hypothetical protein